MDEGVVPLLGDRSSCTHSNTFITWLPHSDFLFTPFHQEFNWLHLSATDERQLKKKIWRPLVIDMGRPLFDFQFVNFARTGMGGKEAMFRELVWFLFFFGKVHALDNSLSDFLRRQVSAWCVAYPWAKVYSYGKFYQCNGTVSEGNLEGVTFKIGIIEGREIEYDCLAVFENGTMVSKDSYSQYILSLLQEALRFKVEFISSKRKQPWKALKNLLAGNLTDLAICHWLPNGRLFNIADFLFSTLDTTEAFVYLPQNLPLTDDVFLETLSRKLWIFFLIAIFLLIISFRFSTSMHSRVRPDHEPWSWDEVVLWAIAAISQQSYSRHPRGSSCRTMFLIGYLITYLIYTGFAAGITSLLALQGHQNRLSFEDVFGMKLQLLLHRDDAFADFFEGPGSRFKHLNFQNSEGESLADIFNKIKQANFVGFGSTLNLLNFLRRTADPRKLEGFLVVPITHSTLRKSFLARKNFPHRKLFDYWLLRLRETGLLSLGEMRYLKQDEVSDYKQAKWLSADLRNVFSAILFLIGGWLLSVVVLLGELLWNARPKKSSPRIR